MTVEIFSSMTVFSLLLVKWSSLVTAHQSRASWSLRCAPSCWCSGPDPPQSSLGQPQGTPSCKEPLWCPGSPRGSPWPWCEGRCQCHWWSESSAADTRWPGRRSCRCPPSLSWTQGQRGWCRERCWSGAEWGERRVSPVYTERDLTK